MNRILLLLGIVLSLSLVGGDLVYAQGGSGSGSSIKDSILNNLEFTGVSANLSDEQRSADARDIVVGIINAALTLFAIAFTILIIYGGWLWMSAAGNQDNVDKAKKTLQWATIGIAVVLLSWTISIFVAGALLEASGNATGLNVGV